MQRLVPRFFSLVLLVMSLPAASQDLSDEALERWFESDDMTSPYDEKGGGEELQFLYPPPNESVPRSTTQLQLTENSTATGWVDVEQCHDDLDAVPDAEVVYQFKRMRGLKVLTATGIEQAWVEGQSVQLNNISHGARLCVELQAQVLHRMDDGRYHLRYGPFQRRFLDTYFPMHIILSVDLSQSGLSLERLIPEQVKGFELLQAGQQLSLDTWFRGKLTIELYFTQRPNAN